MNPKRLCLPCSCGCSVLEASYWEDEEDEIFISYYASSFYERNLDFWDSIKRKLDFLWKILTGKEYQVYEIYLCGEDVKRFKEFVESV